MNITRGKIVTPLRVVLYGVAGIGKSTFASHFPKPLYIDTEGSTNQLDVMRFDPPTSWQMLLAEVDAVIADPSLCDTLIIDTVDWAEKLCADHVCAANGWKSLEQPGYGGGYRYNYEEFCRLLDKLSLLPGRGINVVLVGHAALRKIEQPDEMGSYDKWELKLQNSQKCNTAAKVKEWADMLLFANYKTIVVKESDKAAKGKGMGGKRVMYTTYRPCWDAKNRFGLPEECNFDYSVIASLIPARSAVQAGSNPAGAGTGSVNNPGPVPAGNPAQAPAPETVTAAPVPQQKISEQLDFASVSPSHAKLAALMQQEHFDEAHVRAAVAEMGLPDTPIKEYPPDFIETLIAQAWNDLKTKVTNKLVNENVPF